MISLYGITAWYGVVLLFSLLDSWYWLATGHVAHKIYRQMSHYQCIDYCTFPFRFLPRKPNICVLMLHFMLFNLSFRFYDTHIYVYSYTWLTYQTLSKANIVIHLICANDSIIKHFRIYNIPGEAIYSDTPLIFGALFIKCSSFYPRPVLAFGYCRCLRASVCACVCPSYASLSAH